MRFLIRQLSEIAGAAVWSVVLADVTFSTETLAVVSALLTAVCGVLVVVYRQNQELHAARIADKDRQLVLAQTETNNWKQLGTEAVVNLRKAANARRTADGRIPLNEIPDVVPEHSSPATPEQQKTAELATARAALVLATSDLGLEKRAENPAGELAPDVPISLAAKAEVAASIVQQVAEELIEQEGKPKDEKKTD